LTFLYCSTQQADRSPAADKEQVAERAQVAFEKPAVFEEISAFKAPVADEAPLDEESVQLARDMDDVAGFRASASARFADRQEAGVSQLLFYCVL
jgi:hypothetical protein